MPFPLNETLARLDRLVAALQDFAAREEKLDREHRIRTAAVQHQWDLAQAAANDRLGDQVDGMRDQYEHRRGELVQFFAARKRRINAAHASQRQRMVDRITAWEDRERFAVQKGTLDAERARTAALAAADTRYAEFLQLLAGWRGAFAELERSVREAFDLLGGLGHLLAADRVWPSASEEGSENRLAGRLETLHGETTEQLQRFCRHPLAKLFRVLPWWALGILLILAAGGLLAQHQGLSLPVGGNALLAVAGGSVLLLALRYAGGRVQAKAATRIAAALAESRQLDGACQQKAQARLERERVQAQTDYEKTLNTLNERWRNAARQAISDRAARPLEIDARAQGIYEKCERAQVRLLKQLEEDEREAATMLQSTKRAADLALGQEFTLQLSALKHTHHQQWQALLHDWQQTVPLLHESLSQSSATASQVPDWTDPSWSQWTPPSAFARSLKFGRLRADLNALAGRLPSDPKLDLPGGSVMDLPLSLSFPAQGSLLIETPKDGGDEAVHAINNLIFRVLAVAPPGKVSFTILDPVGLGQNFAALMHLADYEDGSLNHRIWTQTGQIEERLAELGEHMEKVIQMYLRNDYATITEYNAQAGRLAEKYHFLVVASFPANFSDNALKRLRNIAASGARCGVFTLIHWDQRIATPPDFVADELRQNSVNLVRREHGWEVAGWRREGVSLKLDAPPAPEVATPLLHRVGESSRAANRVEVPFSQIAPRPEEFWTGDTGTELRVPIGRSGATKLQYLELGQATRQHALIAGKTGSGKSTLFHVIITNLALFCSPEQVEFYLVDFKKGVEFKCYGTRQLPHARVVAIESDREFGLSVLLRVDEELRRRGDLFRQAGAQDVAGYRRLTGRSLPRSLLMIDEFQEFFTEEDRISQGAAVLLDRIVRQGRAFGVHVILGSQTLGGAYTLARATLGQMVVRIALQCNEADAYLIMDQDNPAPRLLSRPGEGIYNDAAGQMEGNAPFQVVWLGETVRDDYLAQIRARAEASAITGIIAAPFVFEGNAPADVRENAPLQSALAALPVTHAPPTARFWLGAPNAIKGPTETTFARQSGAHLLVVGQAEERTAALFGLGLISLAAQYPRNGVRFHLLDSTPPGFPQRDFLERLAAGLPHPVTTLKEVPLEEQLRQLGALLQERADGQAGGPEVFVFIHGLQQFKKLRAEDDFSFGGGGGGEPTPAATFLNLINEGPARGIHLIVACDTYNNVTRYVGRKTLAEFELRVLFQMSAADSANLIDLPDASTLGLHRALFHHDREGYNETFRPYARPADDWVAAALNRLQSIA